MDNYIFEYKRSGQPMLSSKERSENILFWIVLLSIDVVFAAFLILYFSVSEKYLPFVIVFGILSVFFVPYAFITNKLYYFALTSDNKLVMKSTLNFIPKHYTLDLSHVKRIYIDDPVNSHSVVFADADGKILGSFNHLSMGSNKLKEYMEIIKQRNPHLQVDLTEISNK